MTLNRDSSWLVIAMILAQTLIILLLNINISTTSDLRILQAKIPLINLFIVMISIFSIVAIKKVEENAKYRIEAQLFKSHIEQIETLLRNSRTQKHEYARHMQSVQALIELDMTDEAKDYLNGITEQYWPDDDIYFIGHPALTGLINSKRSVAQLKGIDFAVAVKCDLSQLSIPAWDLCSIIGNLLDNAMEAAIQDKDNPRVGIEFKYENHYYTTYIINNGNMIPDKEKIFEAGYTTKGSEGRGYGLYLVKKLVDKYKGYIEIISEKKTTIIIKLPDGGEKSAAYHGRELCPEIGG